MRIGLIAMFACAAGLVGAARADDAKPPALGNTGITFAAPDGWTAGKSAKPAVAVYVNEKKNGVLAIEVPPDMKGIDENTGAHLVIEIRKHRKELKQKVVMDPKIEADDRFALRIHEKYEVNGKTLDQLHLYRLVGRTMLMTTVNCVSDDPEEVKSIQKVAEDLLLSAKGPETGKAKSGK